jgi:hypothetical protein
MSAVMHVQRVRTVALGCLDELLDDQCEKPPPRPPLALTYYFYSNAACGGACRLEVGYISSPDGGAHWGAATQLAGPMALGEIAQTSQGPMVGDYISTSFSGGRATTVLAVGHEQPTANSFDEALYAPATPLSVATAAEATQPATTAGVVVPVTGIGSGATRQLLRQE